MLVKPVVLVFAMLLVGSMSQTDTTQPPTIAPDATTDTTKQETTQTETTGTDTTETTETTKPDTTTELETTKSDITTASEATVTTTSETTVTTAVTTQPTTPSPADMTLNNYTVLDPKTKTSCISVKAKIQFTISYPSKNGTSQAKIGIPQNYTLTGSCNATAGEYFEVDFDEDDAFGLKLSFQQTSVKGSDFDYAWKEAVFHYTLTEQYFPDVNASLKGANKTATFNMSAGQFKAHSDSSYKCLETQTFTSENVTFQVTDLQYYAYANRTDASFNGLGISECSADSKTNSVVPIAVGAALAGLVVIVLIAYLIGRRRNRKGYESV